jgi:hypothetical protein
MWSDNETVNDLIGFKVHADLIRSVVTDPKLLPITIGIFGDWGNGKTSIMQMVRHDLDPENAVDTAEKGHREKIAVLYFNGWLFEGYDDAKAALLSSILNQLKSHKRFGPKIRDKVVSLLKRVDIMRLAKFGWRNIGAPIVGAYAAAHAGAIPPQIVASINSLAGNSSEGMLKPEESSDSIMDLRTFREEFAAMLKDSDMSSLVVLIDDLDRCSPETIIDNLEAIKLFLNVDKTAFVIGADRRIIRHAITVRYHESVAAGKDTQDDDLRIADDYLEKLIQVPYSLPRLSPTEIETYITLLFCHRDLPPEKYSDCIAKCDRLRAENRFRSFGFAHVKEALGGYAMPAKLHEALGIVSVAATMITECLNGNPRQVKRFLNAYTLRRKLAEVAKMDTLRDDVLIKLMLLEYAELLRIKELAKWQEEDRGYSTKLKRMEDAEKSRQTFGKDSPAGIVPLEWDTERIHRWMALPPFLSEVDLSDYFWLARDRLASSMSGLTMIPPLVRRIFEDLLKKASRPAAARIVKDLNPDDCVYLDDLLTRNLTRQPDNPDAFDAFKAMVEVRPERTTAFTDALVSLPVERMTQSYPGQLLLMKKQFPGIGEKIDLVLEYIRGEPNTKAGKALAVSAKIGR